MEDDKSTTATEEVDTSTNDEVAAEKDLEQDDASFEDFEDDDKEVEDEEEDTEPDDRDSEEDDDDSEDDSDDDESTDPDKDESTEDTSKTEETELTGAARRLEEKRQRELEKAQREQSILDSQTKYVNESSDDLERTVRELQVSMYNQVVTRNTDTLKTQFEKAMKDFDVLSSDNPSIQKRLDRALDAFQAQNVRVDSYGNPVELRASLYDYLQNEADNISELTGISQKIQKKSKSREKSKTSIVPSRAPKEPKKDEMLAGFDEEADRY